MKHPIRTLYGDLLFLPRRDVLTVRDEAAAAQIVRAALDAGAGRVLRQLGEQLTQYSVDSDAELTRVLVRALLAGQLVPIRTSETPRLLDAQQATMLSDLVDPEPAVPSPAKMPEPQTAWISFEVVDDSGNAVDVAFSASVDGQDESGRTDGQTRRFTELSLGSTMTLSFSEMNLPFDAKRDQDDSGQRTDS